LILLVASQQEIHTAIYTANAIEPLTSVIKKRQLSLRDNVAKKLVYLATREALNNWKIVDSKLVFRTGPLYDRV
jgi:transposase-like protein